MVNVFNGECKSESRVVKVNMVQGDPTILSNVFFSRCSIFRGFRDFFKIRENQTREKYNYSRKTRQPRTLNPAHCIHSKKPRFVFFS